MVAGFAQSAPNAVLLRFAERERRRLRGRAYALIRHSRFCLDEGVFAFRSSLLVVSRGLGSVGLPWRWGADPEAILLEIEPRC